MLRFKVEDLISIILDEGQSNKDSAEIKISYSRVNRMRQKLLLEGISRDLGAKELETISLEYPECIKIEREELIVYKKNTEFVQFFIARTTEDDYKDIKKMWGDTSNEENMR
jgi:hypothetical protein